MPTIGMMVCALLVWQVRRFLWSDTPSSCFINLPVWAGYELEGLNVAIKRSHSALPLHHIDLHGPQQVLYLVVTLATMGQVNSGKYNSDSVDCRFDYTTVPCDAYYGSPGELQQVCSCAALLQMHMLDNRCVPVAWYRRQCPQKAFEGQSSRKIGRTTSV